MARRRVVTVLGIALAGIAFIRVYATRARRNPAACPYGQHFFLSLPRPGMSRERLIGLLLPRPGERVLEVGPGIGYYSLAVARSLATDGTLEILDVQQAMLDETMRRARAEQVGNIAPTQGDARALPYPDATFDAAYLVATLGEVPDKDAALRELRRVLKPGGRLVVGESLPDPHMVPFEALQAQAAAAQLRFDDRQGGRFAYLARFHAA